MGILFPGDFVKYGVKNSFQTNFELYIFFIRFKSKIATWIQLYRLMLPLQENVIMLLHNGCKQI